MFALVLLAMSHGVMTQTQRNDKEREMYHALVVDKVQIQDRWPDASKRLQSDYDKAAKCYVKFHLDKTDSCATELDMLQLDLTNEPHGLQ